MTCPSAEIPQQLSPTVSNRRAAMLARASGPTIASSPGRISPPGSIVGDGGAAVQPDRLAIGNQVRDIAGDALLRVEGVELSHAERQFLAAHHQVDRAASYPPCDSALDQ